MASIIARASSRICRSTSWRRVLQRSSSRAICWARVASSVVSISTAIMARSSRPAALIRGASPKPTIPVVSRFLPRQPLTSISAAQPGRGLAGDPGQAVPDHHAILVRERHHVGDRRQRDQAHGPDQEVAEVGRGALAVAEALADLPGQLERDARPAQIAARIGAARQPRVDDHVRLRQARADRVVVGHDQLDAQLAGQLGLADRRDPAIDRDDQCRADSRSPAGGGPRR